MELTQLRYFLKVAELQHITRAAEELYIAQPALTQTIHRLENELEVPLFSAKGRNIVLTKYGHYFYEKLKPLLADIYNLPEQLKTMACMENSVIHLNVLAASSLVTRAIIEYQKLDDKIHFQLYQNKSNELEDIRVTTDFSNHNQNLSDDSFILNEEIYLAVPNTSRFEGKEAITLEEVRDEKFISLSGAKEFRSICDKFCLKNHINPNIIFESDSPIAVMNMIAANIGIGFWPAFTWERVKTENVKLLKIKEPGFSRDVLISYRNNKTDDEKVRCFYEFLVNFFKEEKCYSEF